MVGWIIEWSALATATAWWALLDGSVDRDKEMMAFGGENALMGVPVRAGRGETLASESRCGLVSPFSRSRRWREVGNHRDGDGPVAFFCEPSVDASKGMTGKFAMDQV